MMFSRRSSYPATRMRRLRSAPWLRDLVQETRLDVNDLIWPVFVIEGKDEQQAIASMPGVHRYTIDLLVKKAKEARALGINALAVFPVTPPERKSEDGREAWNQNNLICRAIKEIKNACPEIGIITDVALDPFTTHGHDGITEGGLIINDESVEALCKQAVNQAKAGADIIAPSDMMDGRIGAIRNALDRERYAHLPILSYAAKYASCFYGPFRDAVSSAGCLKGDKKTYQMNPANTDEALHEVELDLHEGADMVMIKPGLPYLDIITRVKTTFKVPTLAYHVSGEYAMLKAAADNGWLDYERAAHETLLSLKRAGADAILTYCAMDVARLLNR